MIPTLSPRAVNRATLDRQLLLARHPMTAREAVRHLAGLQAQAPLAPYVGLWTRLSGFDPEKISTHLSERTVVRAPIMRGTVHLVDTGDFVAFRPLFGPLLAAALRSNYTRRLTGVDLAALVTEAAAVLSDGPRTRAQLAPVLAARWPEADPMALAYAATYLVPVVQVPPRGVWGTSAQATWLSADAWLAPLAVDEDVPAPPRFLPEYDNLLLSHADRRRVIPHDHPVPLWPGNGGTQGTLLIDGAWDATWKITKSTLTISPFRALTPQERNDITEEAARLLAFAAPSSAAPHPDVRFAAGSLPAI